jgi:hypothetical protein
MLKILDLFEMKDKGTVLYCKDDDFNKMTKTEVNDYISKITKIKVYDKNLKEQEYSIKNHDIMLSLSDKISVALLIDKTVDIMIPSDITIVQQS